MFGRAAALSGAVVAALFPWCAGAATFAGVEVPAPLPPRPVSDTHWGIAVEDPYRFLEDTGDAAVQAWMRAQSDATQAILARLPGREALFERLKAIDNAVPAVVGGMRRDDKGRLYYLERDAQANQFKLYRRDAPDAKPVLLVDPEAIARAAGKPHAISTFEPSPDGRHLAYGISASGAEIGTLNVIDARTGAPVLPPIDRYRGGGVTWLPDGSGFFYTRLAEDYTTRPRAERFLDVKNYLRTLAAPGEERAVFGRGVHERIELERTEAATLLPAPERDLVFAVVSNGVQRELAVYRAQLSGVVEGKAAWRRVFARDAQVQDLAAAPDALYLRTAKDAPRFRVLRMGYDQRLDDAREVIGESQGVITDIAAAKDGLYVVTREGAVKRLERLAPGRFKSAQAIALPVQGNVSIADADGTRAGVLVSLGAWTRTTRQYQVEPDGKLRDLALVKPGPYDAPDDIEAREVKVKSHDGVEVPASILIAKGAQLDGRNPTLLYGYGAYGIVEEPSFNPRLLAWLERGGVFVIAHVRGGGVYGDAWRRAGWKATKPNTWKDGIAVAQWLIDNGYTSRERLSIQGGSAGGIFVGRAITDRPDLFSAAVISVGNVDSIRSETRANGAGNIPEYGTVKVEAEFKALLAMSPYANVKPDTAYPAVLFEHGVNDTRVDVWMAAKLASRLAAATTSKRPILMRLDYEAGHGVGSTREQVQRQVADRWSFLLWQAGAPGFQPLL